ncbi:MAG: hypothetical protein NZM44_04465 [Candidatus Calescibacterium sp.]|nr:hypothetical protein [Candidatus Calescibacterium sp.]
MPKVVSHNSSQIKNKEEIKQKLDLYNFLDITKKEEILNFILENKNSITEFTKFLDEAHSKIKEFFGEVPISIELHTDPETGNQTLFIIVIDESRPLSESTKIHNELLEKWFIYRNRKLIRKTGISVL